MLRVLTILFVLVTASVARLQADTNNELIDTIIGFLTDDDKEIRAIALEQIRSDVKGADATKRFADELPKLGKAAQIGLLSALGGRGDGAAKPKIKSLLTSENDLDLRVAAVAAVGQLGDASDCPALIELLAEPGPIGVAARQSLVSLQGAEVSQAMLQQLGAVAAPIQVDLIRILTQRRSLESVPDLLKLAVGKDADLRIAAMHALGQLADPEHVPQLVDAVLVAKLGNERNDAERNLMRVCQRIEDEHARAEPILVVMKDLSSQQRVEIIPALGRVGGKPALSVIENAINSRDANLHSAGIRGISNWPDASVADPLIELAKSDRHPDHRRIARMTILRIAPLPDGRSDEEKLALLKVGMQLATNDSERNYGLKRAAPIRLVETLRFVLPFVDRSSLSKEACQTIVQLAHDRTLRDDNKAEFHAALDKVIATTDDAVLIDRANRYKKGQTWVKPKS